MTGFLVQVCSTVSSHWPFGPGPLSGVISSSNGISNPARFSVVKMAQKNVECGEREMCLARGVSLTSSQPRKNTHPSPSERNTYDHHPRYKDCWRKFDISETSNCICTSLYIYTSNIEPRINQTQLQHPLVTVGGISTPLKNMKVNRDNDIPNIWKNNPVMFQ